MVYEYDNIDEFSLEELSYFVFPNEDSSTFQLLFSGSSAPSKGWFNMLEITEFKVTKVTKTPLFETPPKNIDKDKNLELVGYWEYASISGENEQTAYNPILVYEITTTGLMLDTIATQRINRSIYDQFYGYH